MPNYLKKHYIDCDCEDAGCVIRFTWEEKPVNEWDFFEVQLQMKTHTPWYKRIWESVKYIFWPQYYIRWTEILLDKEKVAELKNICDGYLENK